eukprot:6469003-Amphidinium_carterae.2
MTCYWSKLRASSQLRVEPSGHIGISVLEYPRKGWHPPPMNFMQHNPEIKNSNDVYLHASVVADVSATSKDVVSNDAGRECGTPDSEAQSREKRTRSQQQEPERNRMGSCTVATHCIKGDLAIAALPRHPDFDKGNQARYSGNHVGIYDSPVDPVAAEGREGGSGSSTHACDQRRDGHNTSSSISRSIWQGRGSELCPSRTPTESESKSNDQVVHMHRLRQPLVEGTLCSSGIDRGRSVDTGQIQGPEIRPDSRRVHWLGDPGVGEMRGDDAPRAEPICKVGDRECGWTPRCSESDTVDGSGGDRKRFESLSTSHHITSTTPTTSFRSSTGHDQRYSDCYANDGRLDLGRRR